MAYVGSDRIVYCTADELWAAAPTREDFFPFDGGAAICVWPKSRTPVHGGTKYPSLTPSEFAALLALIAPA